MPARARKTIEAVPEESEEAKRKRLLRQAYGQATSALRVAHQDEFLGLYQEQARELGVEYTPRPNAEQRAAEQFDALVATYPWLADRLTQEDPDAVEERSE